MVTLKKILAFRNCTVRIFFSGDYEYLCRMYGLSVASGMCFNKNIKNIFFKSFLYNYMCTSPLGRHNCLWCTIPSSKLVEPLASRGSFPARTLDSLKADHSRFTSEGHGNLKREKLFNNVIGEALFVIPLDNVRITSR